MRFLKFLPGFHTDSAPPALLPGATQVATPFSDADADTDAPTARDNFQLMAVPKKKPSHARRRIRQHGQRLLEERKNPIVKCVLKKNANHSLFPFAAPLALFSFYDLPFTAVLSGFLVRFWLRSWKPCPGCGMPLRPHFMCLKCHKFF